MYHIATWTPVGKGPECLAPTGLRTLPRLRLGLKLMDLGFRVWGLGLMGLGFRV